MERFLPVRTQLRPPGPWSIQSLRPTTGLAPTSATAGDRKSLTRSLLQTALGTTPALKKHPDDEPAAGCVFPDRSRPPQPRTVSVQEKNDKGDSKTPRDGPEPLARQHHPHDFRLRRSVPSQL